MKPGEPNERPLRLLQVVQRGSELVGKRRSCRTRSGGLPRRPVERLVPAGRPARRRMTLSRGERRRRRFAEPLIHWLVTGNNPHEEPENLRDAPTLPASTTRARRIQERPKEQDQIVLKPEAFDSRWRLGWCEFHSMKPPFPMDLTGRPGARHSMRPRLSRCPFWSPRPGRFKFQGRNRPTTGSYLSDSQNSGQSSPIGGGKRDAFFRTASWARMKRTSVRRFFARPSTCVAAMDAGTVAFGTMRSEGFRAKQ